MDRRQIGSYPQARSAAGIVCESQEGFVTSSKRNVSYDLDEQTVLEVRLKTELHRGILKLIEKQGHLPRDLERILHMQQPKVSHLMHGNLSIFSVRKLLWVASKLGGYATVEIVRKRAA